MKWRYVFWLLLFPTIGWVGYGCVTEPAEFSAARLAGAPVITEQGARPSIVFLSTHHESVPDIRWLLFGQPQSWLHIDLWAFAADDLTPRWVQRLLSVPEGRPTVDYRVIGIENGTVWAMADRLHAVALADGKRIGSATEIEARNPPMAGKFPRTPHDVTFETGLTVNAADGRRWRIDPTSLAAGPAEATNAAESLTWPMMINAPAQALKARATVIDGTWYGMAHSSEVLSVLARGTLDAGISEQNFGSNLSYRLWVAQIYERPNPVFPGRTFRRAENFAPVPRSPEFLRGGLLAARTRANRNQVISLPEPYRLLVLHQDRVDNAARQTLTCLGRDGSVCWEARLDLATATGAALLAPTGSDGGTIILVGQAYPLNATGTARDLGRDPHDVIVRVALRDGGVKRIYLGSLDMRALKAGLAN